MTVKEQIEMAERGAARARELAKNSKIPEAWERIAAQCDERAAKLREPIHY